MLLNEWRIYGYDAGWKDPRVLVEIGATGYGQFVVIDEFHKSGSLFAVLLRFNLNE